MELKAGDRIYQYQYSYTKILVRIVITSVGMTRAFAGSIEFRKSVGTSGAVLPVTEEPCWWIETDALRDEYYRQILLNEWDKVNWNRISTNKLKKIIEILES